MANPIIKDLRTKMPCWPECRYFWETSKESQCNHNEIMNSVLLVCTMYMIYSHTKIYINFLTHGVVQIYLGNF